MVNMSVKTWFIYVWSLFHEMYFNCNLMEMTIELL